MSLIPPPPPPPSPHSSDEEEDIVLLQPNNKRQKAAPGPVIRQPAEDVAPDPQRVRRLLTAGEDQEYPGLTFNFSQLAQLDVRAFWPRLKSVLTLAYQMSYTFDNSHDLAIWALGKQAQLNSVQRHLTNISLLDQTAYDDEFVQPIAKLMTSLRGIKAGPNGPPFQFILLTEVIGEGTVVQYKHPDKNARASVFFSDVDLDIVGSVILEVQQQAIDRVDVLTRDFFGLPMTNLIEKWLPNVFTPSVEPYTLLSNEVEKYASPSNFVTIYYPGRLITLYKPAMFYTIGAVIIGTALRNRIGDTTVNTAEYTIQAADLLKIAQIAHGLPTPPPPFGPGALAWLTLGTYDSLETFIHSPERQQFFSNGSERFILKVKVFYADGTSAVIRIRIRRRSPSRNVITAKTVYDGSYDLFNMEHEDFYKPQHQPGGPKQVTAVRFQTGPTITQKPSHVRGKGIDGNNVFWDRVLLGKSSVFKGYLANFVVFLSKDGEGADVHGCVQRAINCHCKVNTRDAPVICACDLPEDDSSVDIDQCCKLCKEDGDRYMIFVISIAQSPDGKAKGEKDVFLYHLGEHYYDHPDGKVLLVSMPAWKNVQGHCALWLPSEYKGKCRSEAFRMFLSKARYNKVLPKLANKVCSSFCPICGERYQEDEAWSHFIRHEYNYICPSCGLVYDDESSLMTHVKYHCKVLEDESTIILCDENIVFQERTSTAEWIHVYADLESAIKPMANGQEREHENILVGWVDDYMNKVTVAREIKEFFNALVKLPSTDVMVYFHNGEGYDFHFIVKDLCDCRKGYVKDFSIVGDSGQKIRYFSVVYRGKNLHFRDSFAFVSESLEKWIQSSLASGCDFPCFKSSFDEYKRGILLRKNPFPYNAIQHPGDLDRGVDELYGWACCDIAEELFCYKYTKEELLEFARWLREHAHACEWKKVYDYYVDYLKCDVSQLKDVMEFFARNVQDEFGINIHDYYGTPSLSWAAWLSRNKVPLEPITTSKNYDVINSTIRGGQTGVFTRKYVQEEEGGILFDLDCNALYATVMLKFTYPCHDWREEKIPEDLIKWLEDLHASGRSAFIELDLYVKDKPFFYDYIPVASKRTVRDVYNYQAMKFYNGEEVQTMYFKGLTQVLGFHPHYCCHSRNLEWYLKHDIIQVHQIHYILSGQDEAVFHDYVEHNLEQRKKYSGDPIKKMLYKLLNNALYGKTYEDETQREDYCLKRQEQVDTTNATIVRRVICNMGDWVLYEATKRQYHVNKPVYLGACITEFSKLWMYQFYYDRVKVHYPDASVFYTDTDALTLFFPTRVNSLMDLAVELNTDDEQVIDTSNFEVVPTEPRHCAHNNEPGLFKSETGNHSIVKFIGLRAKTYIMVCDDGSIKMSVKGCPMKEKTRLTYDDFERVLFSRGEGYKIEFDAIRSKYHLVRSVRLERIVLSADDRKRYILPDLIHTLPLFSKEHLEALQV